MRIALLASLSFVLISAGCATDDQLGSTTDELISDQLHGDGTAGFFFLPPIVERPGVLGDFVPEASPTVRIDEIDPVTSQTIQPIAAYSLTGGTGDERVRAHLDDAPALDGDADPEGYFVVRWRTRDFDLAPTATYRITVAVPSRPLGFADVDLVLSRREYKNVDADNFVPLVDGDTLRIKFRIDRPAVDADADGVLDWNDNCPSDANPAQGDSDDDGIGDACATDGTTIDTDGGVITTDSGLSIEIPYGAVDQATTITVTEVDVDLPPEIAAVSPVYQFEPEGLVFARPIKITLPLPPGVTTGSVYWSRLGEEGFDPIGGTIEGSTITAETMHFSYAVIGPASDVRTVSGGGSTTWISATTFDYELTDYSAPGHEIEALVLDEAGEFVSLPGIGGTGDAIGTFTIPNVPVGDYILHTGTTYLVTSSNAPDLGVTLGGRPISDRPTLPEGSILELTATNLAPWQLDRDQLEFLCTEADSYGFEMQGWASPPLEEGDVSVTLPLDMSAVGGERSAIQGFLGDRMLVAQLTEETTANGTAYVAMSRAAIAPEFNVLPLDPPAPTAVSVALGNVSPDNTVAFDFRGAAFAGALATYGNPASDPGCGTCGGFVGVFAQPRTATFGQFSANADLLMVLDHAPGGTNVVTGEMHYGSVPDDPAADDHWENMVMVRWSARHGLQLPDTEGAAGNSRTTDSFQWLTTVGDATAGAIVPPILPATDIRVDGASFFAGSPTFDTTPTLTWVAPGPAAPAFYTVVVKELFVRDDNLTGAFNIATIATLDTSLTIPPGILEEGHAYAFTLTVTASTSGDQLDRDALLAAPFKGSLHIATAGVGSGIFGDVHGTPPGASVMTVQDNLSYPMGLAASDGGVFWTERGESPWEPLVGNASGQIWTANLDGSDPHVLASGLDEPTGIAIDGATIYWTNQGSIANDGTIMKLDLVTSELSTIVTDESLGTGLLVVAGDLYYLSGYGLRVLRAGAPAPETLSPDGGVNLASDGVQLFWTQYATGEGNTGRLLAMPVGGGAVTVLADNQAQAWDVHTDGAHVYWSQQAWLQPFPATISRVPVGGGAIETIAIGSMVPDSEIMKVFAIDAASVYYVDAGQLMTVPLAGGEPAVVATLPYGGCPQAKMAAYAGSVYWTDTCGQAVFRVTP